MLSRRFARIVHEIKSERLKGAAWAARKAAEALLALGESGDPGFGTLMEACRLLKESNLSMASVYNVAMVALRAYEEGGVEGMIAAMKNFMEYQSWSSRRIASNARQVVPKGSVILTISFSSNVLNVLVSVREAVRKVLSLESRPGGEGVLLASELRRRGIAVELVPDLSLHLHIGAVDLVMVGADSVTRNGCVVNKVGTRLVAEGAREERVPVVAVFEGYKVHPEKGCGEIPLLRRKFHVEGYGEVECQVFDETPPELIASCVTEYGVKEFTQEGIRSAYERFVERVLTSWRR